MLHRFNFFENSFSLVIPLLLVFCLSSFASNISGQKLPDKIRGYKVHQEKISVTNESLEDKEKKDLGVEVDFEEPELSSVSFLGITLELDSKITVFGKSGTVDFISFRDFKVNGLDVNIEEYRESFDFEKSESVQLKKPVEIFVSTKQTLKGALKEFKNSKDEWLITGRVFVFGRFKKFGFKFKRVIPVEVDLKIKNPLKNQAK
jgi:hypothetical protein